MGTGKSILVVEDESDLAELICYNLQKEGYAFRRAGDGDTALAEIKRRPPNLVLLDRMLPGLAGDDVASELRRDPATAAIPIIMLTAKGEEADQLVGFALGADDYISKPFSMKLLMARVGAMLRRGENSGLRPDVIVEGPYALDRSRHELKVHDRAVALTATEFRLLAALMSGRGRVLSRAQLIDKVLGVGTIVTDRTIDVHITSLRKKISAADDDGSAAAWIQTIRGVGYAFRAPADE
ncbi:MAG: response regulator [Phycisphaerae bacterium]|nr:response regulator [Phycisphaerae bacterium]